MLALILSCSTFSQSKETGTFWIDWLNEELWVLSLQSPPLVQIMSQFLRTLTLPVENRQLLSIINTIVCTCVRGTRGKSVSLPIQSQEPEAQQEEEQQSLCLGYASAERRYILVSAEGDSRERFRVTTEGPGMPGTSSSHYEEEKWQV